MALAALHFGQCCTLLASEAPHDEQNASSAWLSNWHCMHFIGADGFVFMRTFPPNAGSLQQETASATLTWGIRFQQDFNNEGS
jgi:hypothetical protein